MCRICDYQRRKLEMVIHERHEFDPTRINGTSPYLYRVAWLLSFLLLSGLGVMLYEFVYFFAQLEKYIVTP